MSFRHNLTVWLFRDAPANAYCWDRQSAFNKSSKAFATPAPFIVAMILLNAPFAYFYSRRKASQLDMQCNINTICALH